MASSNLAQIEEVFHEAMSYDREERRAYLDRACAGNAVMLHEVASLVAAYDSSSGLLDETAVTLAMRVMGSRPDDSMVGQEVGVYKILSCLGQGGMGTVYLANDTRLNRKVALKFLSVDFISDNWAKRQLVKEAQAVAMLDHPNICAIYDFQEINEHSFIVMQYIEGETLADLIHGDALKTSEIVPLAQQIVSALDNAHAHGIIHRDIKPKNIMVTPRGQVKVLDFGLAKTTPKTLEDGTESISQLSRDGLLVGTIAYMSPEQLRGEKLDFRSDIFSMGTVLYEMVSGKNPHAHKTNAEVISAIMSREPRSLRQVSISCPRGLEPIVNKCLQKDRADRYQSAAALLIDLESSQKGFLLPVNAHSYLNVRNAAIATMAMLTIIVGGFIYSSWVNRNVHTLAVLPITCDRVPANQCIGPMLTDELVNTLKERRGLRVTKSTVAPSLFGSQAATPQRIGRDLNADIVMFGHITNGPKGLILTTRLERVSDGSRIAEDNRELSPDRLALLEQLIALNTAAQLQLPISEEDKRVALALATHQNVSLDAELLYARGMSLWEKRDGENIQKAVDSFTAATDKDPTFAKAWAGLADCYVLMNTVMYGQLASKDSTEKARAAAKKALELNPELAEAHEAQASVLMKGDWDWENAATEYQKAIALFPDFAPAHLGYSLLLAQTGRTTEALIESESAKKADPFSPAIAMNHCRNLYFARLLDRADICMSDIEKEHPDYASGRYMHGVIYLAQGRIPEATKIFEEFYAKDKALGGAMLGYSYGIANRTGDAQRVLNEMLDLRKERQAQHRDLPPQELAFIYLGINDLDNGFAMLQKSADEKYPPLQGLFIGPLFDRFRSEPRFIDVARQVKLPLYPTGAPAAVSTLAK
jgi:serine/threonine protein kinase/Flp pilus assembly protein TadD